MNCAIHFPWKLLIRRVCKTRFPFRKLFTSRIPIRLVLLVLITTLSAFECSHKHVKSLLINCCLLVLAHFHALRDKKVIFKPLVSTLLFNAQNRLLAFLFSYIYPLNPFGKHLPGPVQLSLTSMSETLMRRSWATLSVQMFAVLYLPATYGCIRCCYGGASVSGPFRLARHGRRIVVPVRGLWCFCLCLGCGLNRAAHWQNRFDRNFDFRFRYLHKPPRIDLAKRNTI